jgi:alpha-tubulin suppressor-like RCC1 family protein
MLRQKHPFVCPSGQIASAASARSPGESWSDRRRSVLGGGALACAGAWLALGCGVDSRDVVAGAAGAAAAMGDGNAGGGSRDMSAAFSPDAGIAIGPVGTPCEAGFTCAGDRLLECEAGIFVERELCALGCVSTATSASCSGACIPSSRSCLPGEVPALCDDGGVWQPAEACSGTTPRCADGSCTACLLGERRCGTDGIPEVCSESGGWTAQAPCAGAAPVCLPETGSCAACLPGEQRACDTGAGPCVRGTQTCELASGSTEPGFGACIASQASDGAACDDGDGRTVADSCRQGTCTGAIVGQLATGPRLSCAIRAAGAVYCWGDLSSAIAGLGAAPPTAIELPSPAISLSVGDTHACAVLDDGSVRCWGGNGLGTLGNGTDQPVNGTAAVPLAGVREVAAGSAHSAAVSEDGSVFLWGDYTRALGQTELFGPAAPAPDSGVVATPLQIAELGQVTHIGLGFRHACAALGSGQVVCWGRNDFSQLGRASSGVDDAQAFTSLVPGLDDAVAVASGDSYSCALRETGSVVCWGSLFTSDLTNTINLAPATVPELSGVVQLSVGSSSACALRSDGTVACWGGNAFGELGTGSFNGSLIPQTVVEVDGSPLRDIVLLSTTGANGGRSMCARRSSGVIACWGANDARQLADGTTTQRSRPVDVQGLPD